MTVKIKKHNTASILLRSALESNDVLTEDKVQHRELDELDGVALEEYMIPKIREQHIDEENYKRRKEILAELRRTTPTSTYVNSPYPHSTTTRKGNYAEILMGEYLQEVTDARLPIYRLRYNPNVEQSMKGDDVLLFDLDSEPKRIIVGEAKFRGTPDKQVVVDMINGLLKAKSNIVPISLEFVAERLRGENREELAKKVEDCIILAIQGKVTIDYVGLLMSNNKAHEYINNYTKSSIHNLLMVSISVNDPEATIINAFDKVEAEYERIK